MGEVAQIQFSNVDKLTVDGETPVRLCNYVDVYRNDRITTALDFMEATADAREIDKFQIQTGDVLLTKDSEDPTDIAIPSVVSEPLPGVLCGYHLAMVRPMATRADGRFISWAHTAKSLRAQYEARAVGVTRFGLSQDAFKTARLPLPPIEEQKRIAAFLDASCAAIDAAIAAKRGQIDTIVALRGSTIHAAVTSGVGPLATAFASGVDWIGQVRSGWSVSRVKRVCQLVRGQFGHRPRNDPALYGGDYPFIQTGDIAAADKHIRGWNQSLNEVGLATSKLFRRGTLVMAIAANIGDVGILDFDSCFPDSVVGMIPGPLVRVDYLYYLMRAMRPALMRSAVLTTQLNISYVRIGANFVPLPPLAEQDEIVAYLDARLADLARLTDNIRAQITTLTAYRQSLIHECVTGQRRVTDADVRRAEGVRP
jgi:type I restriction enzyme S subunit